MSYPTQIKVWEALDLYSSFYDHPADWEELMENLGLAEKRNTAFRKLSGGQKQRLSIALALVGNPKIAVLDELTTGLDPQARRDTWQLIEDVRARGVTVLLVTHFMEEAEQLCDRVALIDRGARGGPGYPCRARVAGRRGTEHAVPPVGTARRPSAAATCPRFAASPARAPP